MSKIAKLIIYTTIIALLAIFTILVFNGIVYISGVNDTPRYKDKTVLDIRNETDKAISGLSLFICFSDTFNLQDYMEYHKDPIIAPDIKPKERIIVILDQTKIATAGMYLTLSYGDFDKMWLGKFRSERTKEHAEVGFTSIITLMENKESGVEIKTEGIQSFSFVKNKIFYYKRYSKILEWKNDCWVEHQNRKEIVGNSMGTGTENDMGTC